VERKAEIKLGGMAKDLARLTQDAINLMNENNYLEILDMPPEIVLKEFKNPHLIHVEVVEAFLQKELMLSAFRGRGGRVMDRGGGEPDRAFRKFEENNI